jgi:hypothetical protein
MTKYIVAATSLVALLAVVPALAQSGAGMAGNSQIGSLTCQDISGVSEANQAALIYYAAGYRDGLADASNATSDTSGGADTSSASNSSSSSASSAETGSDAGLTNGPLGGLALSASDIIAACSSSPTMLLSDVIASNGGAMGMGSTSSPESSTSSSSDEASGDDSSSSSSAM